MEALFERPAVLVLAVVMLVLFGAKRLPDLARGVGQSMRILKSETRILRGEAADGAEPAGADTPRA